MKSDLIRKADAVRIVLHYEGQAAVAAMQDLKPVDAAPVEYSRWLKVKGFGNKHIHQCQRCGKYLDFRGVNAGRGDASWCPVCGARMLFEIDPGTWVKSPLDPET